MPVSIIIPVLNEEKNIKLCLESLQRFRKQGHEVIVTDGGSEDQTCNIAKTLADKVVTSAKGRALQMNLGAAGASHDVLWFLHADTRVTENAIAKIETALLNNDWGRFNVKLSGSHWLFRIIETMMNIRSCVTGIATGDQGIFVKRNIFESVKAYPEIALMEDIELSRKLKKISKPVCLNEVLTTSSRRWEEKGIMQTVFLMWKLRLLYFMGVSAEKLARHYK
jgi:rSAM/selenodomain-associated transferase 2